MKVFLIIFLIGSTAFWGRDLSREMVAEFEEPSRLELESIGVHRILGPLKGIVAGLAWVEVFRCQRAFLFEEVDRRTQWICALQPHVVDGWDYLSWNLAFNLYAEAGDGLEQKGKWLRRGLDQLDLGLSLNPDSPRLLYSKAVTLFIRSKEAQGHHLLKSIGYERPLVMAAEIGLSSRMLELGNWPEATMVLGMLQKADKFDEAIAACDGLENRFPNQLVTLKKLKKLFSEEKYARPQ